MRKLITLSIVLCAASFFGSDSAAQSYDPMFTMYEFQPLNINPALTGNQDNKWRVGALYREQGYTMHRPFRTFSGSFDMNAPINAWNGNIWGFGLTVQQDDQGDAYLVERKVLGNFALGQFLDSRLQHSLSVGFQGGLVMRAIDYSDGYWDNQWAREGFTRELPTGEPLVTDIKNYFVLSTGLQYSYVSGNLVEFYSGVSVYNVNNPDNSLLLDTSNSTHSKRTNVHAEFVHRLRDNSMFALRPSVLYSRQAERFSFRAGSNFQFLFKEGTRTTGRASESSITFGLFGRGSSQRLGSAFDLMGTMSLEIAGFSFGAGYDIPLGSINNLSYEGAFEFMLSYRAGYKRGLYNKYAPKRKGKL